MANEVKVNWRELYDAHRSAIPEHIMVERVHAALLGETSEYIYISQEDLDAIRATEEDRAKEEEESQIVSSHRLAGMAAEKDGDLEKARNKYTLCINYGENVATHTMFSAYAHAYARLFVVLRKLGLYEQERHYLESYLRYDRLTAYERTTYTKRLRQVNKKLSK